MKLQLMQLFSLLFAQWHKTSIKCNMSGGYLYFAVVLLLLFVFPCVCVFTHTTECTAEDLLKSRHLLRHDLNSLTTALA